VLIFLHGRIMGQDETRNCIAEATSPGSFDESMQEMQAPFLKSMSTIVRSVRNSQDFTSIQPVSSCCWAAALNDRLQRPGHRAFAAIPIEQHRDFRDNPCRRSIFPIVILQTSNYFQQREIVFI